MTTKAKFTPKDMSRTEFEREVVAIISEKYNVTIENQSNEFRPLFLLWHNYLGRFVSVTVFENGINWPALGTSTQLVTQKFIDLLQAAHEVRQTLLIEE